MKNGHTSYIKALVVALMTVLSLSASAASKVETSRTWTFGTSGNFVVSSSLTDTDGFLNTGNGFSYEQDDLTLYRANNNGSDAVQRQSGLYSRKTLGFSFTVGGKGTITVSAEKWNDTYSKGASSGDTYLSVYTNSSGSGSPLCTLTCPNASTPASAVVDVADGTTLYVVGKNSSGSTQSQVVYSIAWAPDLPVGTTPLTMTLALADNQLQVGDETSVSAAFFDSNDAAVTGLSGVTYSTSTPSVVSVSASGDIVALGAGTAVIEASFPGNETYAPTTASISLIVTRSVLTYDYTIGKSVLEPGETTTLGVSWWSGEQQVNINSSALSTNTAVATVDASISAGTAATVTGVASGSATMKVGIDNDNYVVYSRRWDFDDISSALSDKAAIPYDNANTVTVNRITMEKGTGVLEGLATQGSGVWMFRNDRSHGLVGLYNNNSGHRYLSVLDLDAGDIVTIAGSVDETESPVNGVLLSSSDNVYRYRVSADGNFTLYINKTGLIHSITVEAATPVHVPVSVAGSMVQPEIKAAGGDALSTLSGTALGLEATGSVDIAGRFAAYHSNTDITAYGTLSYSMPSGDISLSGTTLSASSAGANDLTITWIPSYTAAYTLGLGDSDLNLRGLTDYNASTSTASTNGDGNRYIGWHFGDDGLDLTGYTHAIIEVEPAAIPLRVVVSYQGSNDSFHQFPAGTRYLYVPLAETVPAKQIYINLLESGSVKLVSAKLANGQYLPEEETITIQAVDKTKAPLYMRATVEKSPIEIDETTQVTVRYYSDDDCTNEVTAADLQSTFKTSKSSVATVSASGLVTGVATGTVTVTATTTGNSDYQGASATVEVEVEKIRIAITITPGSAAKLQAETQQLTATVTSERTGNVINDAEIKWSTSEFDPSKSGYNAAYTALVDVTSAGLVTAMNPGHGPGIPSGKALITAAFDGSKSNRYYSRSESIEFTVNDNTCFDYMGWDLQPGHTGTLYEATDPSRSYVHWRFGAPNDDRGVQVFRYNGNNNKMYEFTSEIIALKEDVHTSESPIDVFNKTRLTDTQRTSEAGVQLDAKGDAFLEYNGMIAGYGTEFGGRYMTPISGTFVRIEAEYDGVVSVLIRHNGSVDRSNAKEDGKSGDQTKYKNITQARRALFVVDENGVVMPRTSNYATLDSYGYFDDNFRATLGSIDGTYARISDNSKVTSTYDIVNDAYTYWFQHGQDNSDGILRTGSGNNVDFSRNAFQFSRRVIYNGYSDADYNSRIRSGNGGDSQRLFYSASQDHVEYQADGVATKSYFFSKYGYEVLGAAHLCISFPVKAGKTYFVGANKSKVGLCSVGFVPASGYSAANVTLYDDAVAKPSAGQHSNAWLLNTADGAHLNVTLDRKFTANHWHPLVLPFSVSETQLKSIFGENVALISLDGDMRMLSSMNNYATRDIPSDATGFYDSTTPVYDDKGNYQGTFNGRVIKPSSVRDRSVTFTRHYYQMIYANCPVFLWTDRDVNQPVFKNVTFQKYTLQKEEVEGLSTSQRTPAINNDYTVTFPYSVDRQIGTGAGTDHDYVMKASYVASKPAGEVYYLNNVGSGSSATAYLYHAEAGYAPTMKGTRVWIEPGTSNPKSNQPLRSIRMQQFWGEDIDADDVAAGITEITADQPVGSMADDDNVYDVTGRIVGRGTLDGLNPGLYIFHGHKIILK